MCARPIASSLCHPSDRKPSSRRLSRLQKEVVLLWQTVYGGHGRDHVVARHPHHALARGYEHLVRRLALGVFEHEQGPALPLTVQRNKRRTACLGIGDKPGNGRVGVYARSI